MSIPFHLLSALFTLTQFLIFLLFFSTNSVGEKNKWERICVNFGGGYQYWLFWTLCNCMCMSVNKKKFIEQIKKALNEELKNWEIFFLDEINEWKFFVNWNWVFCVIWKGFGFLIMAEFVNFDDSWLWCLNIIGFYQYSIIKASWLDSIMT